MKVNSVYRSALVLYAPMPLCGKKQKNAGRSLSFKGNENNNDDRLWLAVMALAGIEKQNRGTLNDNDKNDVLHTLMMGNSNSQKTLYGMAGDFRYAQKTQLNPSIGKYTDYYYGVALLVQNNVSNRDDNKYKQAISNIQEIGYRKLTSKKLLPEIKKDNGEAPVIWSITSEFAPVKEGGLGVVPVELRNNITKLGIDIPTFVPMYLNDGQASLREENGKYNYNYKGKNFELEKVMSFKLDSYKNSNIQNNNIDIFLSRDKNGGKLVFIKCDKYFDGTIYEANPKTEEPEKFAIMSKAVYELAKMKIDGLNANRDVKIYSNEAYESIKTPDAMILNDWQASPVAALMRYKAGMENAYGALSDGSAAKLKDMPIITIGHNVTYQGSTQGAGSPEQTRQANSNILNTLFDRYAFDIVHNAEIHTERFNDDKLLPLNNVLLMNKENENESFVNFLNMGIVLSDYFCPVSENYKNELISPDKNYLSNYLQWALVQKNEAGKLKGIINGNDFENLNIKAKSKNIKNMTGLDFKMYDKSTGKGDLVRLRKENKMNFYNNFILPFAESSKSDSDRIDEVKKLTSRLEFYKGKKPTIMPDITEDTPVLSSGGRLVSQKGLNVLAGAVEILYNNWDKDFPNKPKPIFYIAGQDGEGGTQRKIVEELKNKKLSSDDNNRVLFAHGFVPMPAMMAASDFFLMPSLFEPCGLTQGEAFALGTPVIASAVGGIVDTVNRGGKHNGILSDKNKELTPEEFYKAIKNGLEIYFDKKDEYNNMVKNSIDEDFSWIQKGKKGPVYDYLDIIGLKRENLPDAA